MDTLLKLLDKDRDYLSVIGMCDEDDENYGDFVESFTSEKYTPSFKRKKLNKNVKHISDLDLKITPMINEEDTYITTHKNLPKIPFSALVSGARGSGKSVLSGNLLRLLSHYFDEVILYCPTADLDLKWKLTFEELGLEWKINENVFFNYDENILHKQMKCIWRLNKGKKKIQEKMKTCFIFDDMISQLPKNKKNTIFNRLLLNNRHYAASVIVISQSYMLLDSNFRKNCSQIFLWKTENLKELKNFHEELTGCLGKSKKECCENFTSLYEEATSQPHSCLYINYHQEDKRHRFHRNFDDILIIEDCDFFKN